MVEKCWKRSLRAIGTYSALKGRNDCQSTTTGCLAPRSGQGPLPPPSNRLEIWILSYNGYFLGPKTAVFAVFGKFSHPWELSGHSAPRRRFLCVMVEVSDTPRGLIFEFWIQNFNFWAVTASSGTKLTVFHGFPRFSTVFHGFPWFPCPWKIPLCPSCTKASHTWSLRLGMHPRYLKFEFWAITATFWTPKSPFSLFLVNFLTRESCPGTQHPAGAFCVWWLRLVIHHEAWYSNFEFKILNLSCNG